MFTFCEIYLQSLRKSNFILICYFFHKPMNPKTFAQIFDKQLLSENTFMIDERGGQSCDFFLLELVKHFNFSIFQYNDSGAYLKKAISKYNVNSNINSIYFANYNSEEIIDDVFSQKLFGIDQKSKIGVFRSETAMKRDYYSYDFIVLIDRLISGCTDKIDGCIKILKRDRLITECKYKIHSDKILYFD